jgi:hypothetical protein
MMVIVRHSFGAGRFLSGLAAVAVCNHSGSRDAMKAAHPTG